MHRYVLAVGLLLAAGAAAAQDSSRFRSRVGAGTVTGTEEFTIVRAGAGQELTSRVTMRRGGSESTFTVHESLTAEWTADRYSVDMAGALGTAAVSAERKGDTLALVVRTPAGTPSREIPVKPRTVLMDNMLAAPFQVLLNMTGAKPGSLTLIVPFQLAAVDAVIESAGTAAGTLDGKPVTVTRLRLKAAGSEAEIDAEAATNRLLRVFVVSQDAELVREGYAGPPEPKPAAPPAGVTERQVEFKSTDGQVFPATLCLPKPGTPSPLIVFIQGSGPQDRDETIGPNKPFRDLAWGLAERGVATLRYDKRTYAFPKTYTGTLESESIDDAVEAVKLAQTLPEVDRKAVFVLGHSLGGLAAPYVAERVPVRGLVLMAAPGRSMELVIRDQVRTLNAGQSEAVQAQILQQQDAIMAKVRAGTATREELNNQPPQSVRDMIVRDPIAELQKTTVPLLVLKGGKDAQIFQADFDALQALARVRPGSAAKLFPNLTHTFTLNEGPVDFRAIYQPAHVATEVVETIAAWVRESSRQ